MLGLLGSVQQNPYLPVHIVVIEREIKANETKSVKIKKKKEREKRNSQQARVLITSASFFLNESN